MTYILIVEDNIDNAEILTHYLEVLELPIEHVTHGYQLVKHVTENPPILIFMDINLPDDDGRVICNQIKNRLGDIAPKIIVMTAAYGSAQNRVSRQMGADDFIKKPLRQTNVLQKARNLLAVSQS